MFPRDERLVEKRLFALLFRRGQWVRGRQFSLVFFASQRTGKIAFIVTRKQAKLSVERNRLKRRIRAGFLTLLREPPYAPLLNRHNLIVVIHRNSNLESFDVIAREVRLLLDR